MATTANLTGTVGSDSTASTVVTFTSSTPAVVTLIALGTSSSQTGAIRYARNGESINTVVNASVPLGFPATIVFNPGASPTLSLYTNGSESNLTYHISINNLGRVA